MNLSEDTYGRHNVAPVAAVLLMKKDDSRARWAGLLYNDLSPLHYTLSLPNA